MNNLQQQSTQMGRKDQRQLTEQVKAYVKGKVDTGALTMPPNYSVGNAVTAAYFMLTAVDFQTKQALIDKVSPESVAYALQDMCVQGLSAAKKQGYFINYGGTLQWQRSYHGTKALIQRMNGVKDVWANVIWEGDTLEVEYVKGKLTIKEHKHDWLAATGKKEDIKGAYAIVEMEDGAQYTEIMPMAQILTAWSTSKNTSVQNKYPQEMAKRTVINRLGKHFINTSDDSDILMESVHRTDESEYPNERVDITPEDVRMEIEENANVETLDMPKQEEVIESPQEEVVEMDEPPF